MTVKEYNNAVDSFSDSIFRFILKNINDYEKARDIVQDAYERLWLKKDQVDTKKVKSYLFTTAYHAMIDMIRKEKLHADFQDNTNMEYFTENQYSDLNEILHRAIKKLPETQRAVILLRDYEGYSYEEISNITGLNESQVKVYIYRGRMFLKKYIVSPDKVV